MQVINTAQLVAAQPTAGILNGGQQMQGGDFLAMILQMLGQNGQEMLAIPDGLFSDAQTMQNLEDELEQNGSEAAMQLLAGLFAAPTADLQMVTADGQKVTLAADGAHVKELLSQAVNQPNQGLSKQPQAPSTEQEQGKDFIEILSNTTASAGTGGKESSMGTLSGQAQFQNAVMQAQKELRVDSGARNTKDSMPDIDKLQQEVNLGRYLGGGLPQAQSLSDVNAPKAQLPIVDARSILAQVKTGITENISRGKNEFIIRLKPEGLGEITVKMLETGSKITLSIITSTEQAQRALSSELSALRESLRPLNAEVQQVVTQDSTSYLHSGSQSFSEHRNQQHGADHPNFRYTAEQTEEQPNWQEPYLVSGAGGSELDAYI